MSKLEEELKAVRTQAEDADKKYDEGQKKLVQTEADLERTAGSLMCWNSWRHSRPISHWTWRRMARQDNSGGALSNSRLRTERCMLLLLLLLLPPLLVVASC